MLRMPQVSVEKLREIFPELDSFEKRILDRAEIEGNFNTAPLLPRLVLTPRLFSPIRTVPCQTRGRRSDVLERRGSGAKPSFELRSYRRAQFRGPREAQQITSDKHCESRFQFHSVPPPCS